MSPDPLVVQTASSADPGAEYRHRLRRREAVRARHDRQAGLIATARLITFLGGLVLGAAAWWSGDVSAWWLLVPAAVFGFLVVAHEIVLRRRALAQRACDFYEEGLARLEDRWAGRGPDGEAYSQDDHPYARHLDLFGVGSVFQLLCRARTDLGQAELARWLTHPVERDETLQRQQAVAELAPGLDTREENAVAFALPSAVNTAAVAAWGRRPRLRGAQGLRVAAGILAAATLIALVAWFWPGVGAYPLLALLVAEYVFASRVGARMASLERDVDVAVQEIEAAVALLRHLESARFEAPLLRQLQQTVSDQENRPSECLVQLRRRMELLDSGRNPFFAPLAALMLWRTQVGLSIEAWRMRHGEAVTGWFTALARYEALQSLAGYAYENPDHAFPRIVEGPSRWQGEEVGHPLLPRSECVRNDVALGGEAALLIVSGSNMSGKTTLLRTIGVNTVLAHCGAPVRARRLELTPVPMAASIYVQDSLSRGASRFYAQVEQLRRALDLVREHGSVLFLVDEILSGTNSRDRRIGGEAVLRRLLDLGGIGAISTHDLTLTAMAEAMGGRSTNVHFIDHLEDGRMVFDYRLRPGVVEGSNALALMRSVGLLDDEAEGSAGGA